MQISKNNYVNVLENLWIKTDVAIIFIQRDNNAHCIQNVSLILLHCSQCLPEIISYQNMVCWHSSKKHVNVTTSLKNLLYLCLIFSGYVKHNRKFPCGNSIFQDKTVMYYIHHTMSMWGQYEKATSAFIHHIRTKMIQSQGHPPFLTIHHSPTHLWNFHSSN